MQKLRMSGAVPPYAFMWCTVTAVPCAVYARNMVDMSESSRLTFQQAATRVFCTPVELL